MGMFKVLKKSDFGFAMIELGGYCGH